MLYWLVMDVSIVGIGNVGGALAIALHKAGYDVAQLVVRSDRVVRRIEKFLPSNIAINKWRQVESIDSKLIVVATADPEIQNAGRQLLRFASRGQIVVHTSGSLASDVLDDLAKLGCETGSFHPLVAISDSVAGAERFKDAFFCVEGSKSAVKAGRKLARDLGGRSFTIAKDKKPLYHASAVTAAGHVVALFDCALEMLTKCGVSRAEASKILLPLIKSSVGNLEDQTPERALTGTFARLDIEAFERHLNALSHLPGELGDIYMVLAKHSLSMVSRSHLRGDGAKLLQEMISLAKENRR